MDTQFTVYVLTQILPHTNLFRNEGNKWRVGQQIPGLEAIANQTFSSKEELCQAIVENYQSKYQPSDAVRDINQGGASSKKAV